MPQPKDITEEELLKLLEAEDPFGFRVPMSIGEPHAEIDKSKQGDWWSFKTYLVLTTGRGVDWCLMN